ncbi:10959_t:CDS:2 [Ambispora gerdemannii]|uniref:10959_t:CDS:1 n=1 Tax=Ambispora gerdemannii TaxID=144530 RepID=A0A9N9FMG3_9GLOM|nr:10959_t:CDS:2 [Ambispora gerdemannii]
MTETAPLSNLENPGPEIHTNFHTRVPVVFEKVPEPSPIVSIPVNSEDKSPPLRELSDQSNAEQEAQISGSPTNPSLPPNSEVEETYQASETTFERIEDEETNDCPCQKFSVAPGSATCTNCDRLVPALAELYRQRLQYIDDLDVADIKIKEECKKSEQQENEIESLKKKVIELEDQIDARTDELNDLQKQIKAKTDELDLRANEVNDLQRAMNVLNEKYVDEIDKVAELQHSKDMVEGELEELSRSLFEQANKMVAKEAKQRYELEVQRKSLENQLQETKERLLAESSQLQELRERMQQMVQQQPEPDSKRSSNHSDPAFRASVDLAELFGLREKSPDAAAILPSPTGEDGIGIDDELLSEFRDFVNQSTSSPIKKIHTLPFMRHCLEEDVDPCMRFGNNPRVSARRIVDAIVANTCCIEEAPFGADKELALNHTSPIRNSAAKPIFWGFPTNTTATPRAGCQCCGRPGSLPFQYRITPLDDWSLIDRYCRDRLVAVCEFYVFIRNVHQGFYNNRKIEDLYAECLRLRLQMFYARLGALPSVLNTLGIKGTELASARKPSLPLYEFNEKHINRIDDGTYEEANYPNLSNGNTPSSPLTPSSPTEPAISVSHPSTPTPVAALASLTLLRNHLYRKVKNEQAEAGPVALTLHGLLEKLNEPLPRHKSFLPSEIIWALQANARKLINREQQDAHELFALLSSALSDEEEAMKRPKPLFDLSIIKNLVDPNLQQTLPTFTDPVEKNPLLGLTACRISCMQCGHSGPIRHTTFDHISVPLPHATNCTLEQVLRSYTSLEFIDEFNCRNCGLLETLSSIEERLKQIRGEDDYETMKLRKQLIAEKQIVKVALTNEMEIEDQLVAATFKNIKTSATKQTMFARLPSIFATHFSRTIYVPNAFGGMMLKNPCQVKFPAVLNMESFLSTGYLANMPSEPSLSSSSSPSSSPILAAVGVMGGGHLQRYDSKPFNPIGSNNYCYGTSASSNNNHNSVKLQEAKEDARGGYYRLSAVIVHLGDHSRGHFVTYRRQSKDEGSSTWWRASDEDVREVGIDTVLREEAYMLFYERMEKVNNKATEIDRRHIKKSDFE